MARIPKPWFREDRQAWFVTIRGERHNLGTDEKEAKRRFYELMAQPEPESLPAAPAVDGLTVAEVFEKFLDWTRKHRAKRTYDWYKDHFQSFVDSLPEPARMPVVSLKPFHVIEWADKHVGVWGDTYRRGALIAIQRPFNWTAKLGYIDASPIRYVEKPPAKRREQVVTPEKWVKIRMNCRFLRLKKHLGVKYAAYSLRHGFATRKLEGGLDHITVAALMGHAEARQGVRQLQVKMRQENRGHGALLHSAKERESMILGHHPAGAS